MYIVGYNVYMKVGDVICVRGKDDMFRVAHIHKVDGDKAFGDMFLEAFSSPPLLSSIYCSHTPEGFKLNGGVIRGSEISLGKNYSLLGNVALSSNQQNWMDILDDLK